MSFASTVVIDKKPFFFVVSLFVINAEASSRKAKWEVNWDKTKAM